LPARITLADESLRTGLVGPDYISHNPMKHDSFRRFAALVARKTGSGWTFLFAVALLTGTGVYYGFSDNWKNNVSLVATVTALILLFLLQKSQNHSDKATHIKLDELIQATKGARNEIAFAEEKTEQIMDELRQR
jgi:low affinity Fe/Cu permease